MALISNSWGGMVPVGAGYGSVVPGPSTLFPGGMGTPNNQGGYNFTVQGAQQQQVTPWSAPLAQSAATGAANTTSGTGGGTAGAGGSSGWLSGLLGQIAGTPGPSIPPLPDLGGMNQAQKNLLNYTQWLQSQANDDNNKRFNWAVQALAGQGTSAKADVEDARVGSNAQNNQDLISRGLNNSTVGPSLQMGTQDMANRANQRIDEGTAKMLVDLLESKQTSGPSMNQLFQMMQSATNGPSAQSMVGNSGGIHYLPMGGANIVY